MRLHPELRVPCPARSRIAGVTMTPEPDDGNYSVGATDALYWRPTAHSPWRRLTPYNASPEQRHAVRELHEANLEAGNWIPQHHPPCVINYLRGRPKPWAVKWRHLNDGRFTGTELFPTREAALESAPMILKSWENAGLGLD